MPPDAGSSRDAEQLRADARAIWTAGVAAVDSRRLARESIHLADGRLRVVDWEMPLNAIDRLVIVGAGKAATGMAEGVLDAVAELPDLHRRLVGWINVPNNCVRPVGPLQVHPGRPAGLNEPTEQGVAGAREILQLVSQLGPDDVCLCLLSGGASALLPLPVEGVSLHVKQQLTRELSGRGANIEQLNCVRKQISRIKGGRLAAACRGAHLLTLVISDVLGDPLDIIGSGPTVADPGTPSQALEVLRQFELLRSPVYAPVVQHLQQATPPSLSFPADCHLFVIGNNAVAVDSAGMEAERRGYTHAMTSARQSEGSAESVAQHLTHMALRMRSQAGPDCLISGGEPVVNLVQESQRGRGGRNQQLALAALQEFRQRQQPLRHICLLSGGTDGEDGPTDAAGAWVDENVDLNAARQSLDPQDYLRRNDAYSFFERTESLLKTGPTDTNVCDLRVLVTSRDANL